MTQITNLWKEAAEANSAPRYPWRALFGMSLTAKVTILRNLGLTAEDAFNTINREFPGLTDDAKRRLQINISARYAEQGAQESRRLKE